MYQPLADRIRPASLEELVGQQHILKEGSLLYNCIQNGDSVNMIFYGPSGTGKTTVAHMIAKRTNKKFYKLNATTASVGDVKDIIANIGGFDSMNGILLYLDEIQNFNKKQQQSLLEVIENGDITLIASTTENPYFYVFNAILSRSMVFEFKPLTADDIQKALSRALSLLEEDMKVKIDTEPQALAHLSEMANGDVRRAINSLEFVVRNTSPVDEKISLTLAAAEQATQRKAISYDKLGDSHYDILSALQKSIRGSDPQAGLHYAARLIAAGDLQSLCRRLLVIAAEDIGLAYPMAISIVNSCVEAAFRLGLPEARIPLAEAVILLATAPKSNSAVCGIDAAMEALETTAPDEIPSHLRDSHYKGAEKLGRGMGYQYPHSFPNHYVEQQYLPDNFKDHVYYKPQENKFEQSCSEYWRAIKKGSK